MNLFCPSFLFVFFIIPFFIFNFQNFVSSVEFLNLSEILQPKLQLLEVEFQQKNWATNPSNVFDNLIALLTSEYRNYKCNERKSSSKACEDNARHFVDDGELSGETEKFGENGKTNEFLIGVTKKFMANLKRKSKGANSKMHFESANDRQIYDIFIRILSDLSANLEEGIEKEVINEFLKNNAETESNCADLLEMTMKLWIVMFPSKDENFSTNDWSAIAQRNDRHNGQVQRHTINRNAIIAQPPSSAHIKMAFRLRRRKRTSPEMVKHVVMLGVSLCASYFVMTSLKNPLQRVIEHFDNPRTIFGTAVLLYLGTLYMFERRKVKKDEIKKSETRKEETKRTNERRSDSIIDELANSTTVTVMDIVSYKSFMEELYGRKLDTDHLKEHYKEYREQIEQLNGSGNRQKRGEYGSTSRVVSEGRKYGNLEEKREENGSDRDTIEDLPSDYQEYEEYLKYMEEKRRKMKGKKKSETEREREKKSPKGMAMRLAMPGCYEMRSKNKSMR